jgi:tryptophan synthase alpha subunit
MNPVPISATNLIRWSVLVGVVVGSALVRLLHEEFGKGKSEAQSVECEATGSWEKVTNFIAGLKASAKKKHG